MTHYERCPVCKGWLSRDHRGVLRHRKGEGARCDAILSNRVRSIRDTGGLLPAAAPPIRPATGQYCLFCKSVIEDEGPDGFCLACVVRMKGEL